MSSLPSAWPPPAVRRTGCPEKPADAVSPPAGPTRPPTARPTPGPPRARPVSPASPPARSAATPPRPRPTAVTPTADVVRPPRHPSRSAGASPAPPSRSASTSSRVTCTPSWSSSWARTSMPPTSTRPTSRAASARCSPTSCRARTGRSATPTGPDHPGDQRRHPRLRPDRAVPARLRRDRGHGQRVRPDLPRARGQADAGQGPVHRRGTCVAPSTRSCPASAVASTSRAPWWTPVRQDGSRVNAVIPPLAIDGSCLTIRKFATDPLTVHNLIDFGSISEKTADFLDACVRGRLNIIVSGGTGAGEDDHAQRVVVLHPQRRAHRDHRGRRRAPAQAGPRRAPESRPNNIEGKGAVPIRDLVKNSLRMRPDRIVVGEVRDACTRHAAGHEHRSRRLDLYPPLQRSARHPGPHGDHGADGRHGAAGARHPRAGGLRGRPDRAPGPLQGRLAGSPTSPRWRPWRAT